MPHVQCFVFYIVWRSRPGSPSNWSPAGLARASSPRLEERVVHCVHLTMYGGASRDAWRASEMCATQSHETCLLSSRLAACL